MSEGIRTQCTQDSTDADPNPSGQMELRIWSSFQLMLKAMMIGPFVLCMTRPVRCQHREGQWEFGVGSSRPQEPPVPGQGQGKPNPTPGVAATQKLPQARPPRALPQGSIATINTVFMSFRVSSTLIPGVP